MHISIAKDFSDTPWGRFPSDSQYSGEAFRETLLRPALEKGGTVVDLDGVEGLGSSFLDEAFGGLVRKGYFTADQLEQSLQITTTEKPFEMYAKLVWRYIKAAKRETA